jgi:hypothetical protein
MTSKDILALSGRELDTAVEMNFFRERYLKNGGHDTPHYCTDANACREIEMEMERRGLNNSYIHALSQLVLGYVSRTPGVAWSGYGWEWSGHDVFALVSAPLETKCRAALLALMETKEKDHAE